MMLMNTKLIQSRQQHPDTLSKYYKARTTDASNKAFEQTVTLALASVSFPAFNSLKTRILDHFALGLIVAIKSGLLAFETKGRAGDP